MDSSKTALARSMVTSARAVLGSTRAAASQHSGSILGRGGAGAGHGSGDNCGTVR